MLSIPRKYLMDESNEPIAVQLDLAVFKKIESVLEDYALGQILAEAIEDEEELDIESAKLYYKMLGKSK